MLLLREQMPWQGWTTQRQAAVNDLSVTAPHPYQYSNWRHIGRASIQGTIKLTAEANDARANGERESGKAVP